MNYNVAIVPWQAHNLIASAGRRHAARITPFERTFAIFTGVPVTRFVLIRFIDSWAAKNKKGKKKKRRLVKARSYSDDASVIIGI